MELKKVPFYDTELNSASNDQIFCMAFLTICKEIIAKVENGSVRLEDGAYTIAGLMFWDRVSKIDRLFDVCLHAGELELPAQYVSGDVQEKWNELKKTVQELSYETERSK